MKKGAKKILYARAERVGEYDQMCTHALKESRLLKQW